RKALPFDGVDALELNFCKPDESAGKAEL
ncbi:MAG: hypothetical protein QOH42_2041, partial [Blastocatellia bacterium]|nr:hypothetical protein [Blastocatellia bacterium]